MKTAIEEAIKEIRKMTDDKEVTFNFGLTTAIEILNNKLPKEREQIEGFAEWKVGLLTKQVDGKFYFDYNAKWLTTTELLEIYKQGL